ncbi:MAG: DUF2868 domain-containing protein [Burkholderiales bacterium]
MNETEARKTLLLRAFEAPLTVPWAETDRDWATREALVKVGSQASPDRLIATRAAFGAARLGEREPAVGAVLGASARNAGLEALLLVAAFAAGVALDSLGAQGRIEILSPPLLGLLVWNLAVYLWLIVLAARPRSMRTPRETSASRKSGKSLNGSHKRGGWVRTLIPERWRRSEPNRLPAIAHFAADWATRGQALRNARLIALLHAGAALLALGALASLYLRGLVFEFRAGWDSTFLDASAVHALAAALYGPASFVSGIALPGADEIARLRFTHGTGENAARWIHLQALTVVGAIVLPRAVLSAIAKTRASRLARRFPLPLTDAYYRRLLPRPAEGVPVCVLPYSYQFPEARLGALQLAIEEQTGARVVLEVADSIAPGGEDDLDTLLPPEAADAHSLIALFPLTATPERETHGAFVRALSAHHTAGTPLRVLVDETDFRTRFGAEGEARLAQRHDAWRRLFADEGLEPEFIDLTPAAKRQ